MLLKDYAPGRWQTDSICMWTSGTLNGQRYRLTRFTNVSYPISDDGYENWASIKLDRCNAFCETRRHLNLMLKKADGGEGNIAFAETVFINNMSADAPGVIEATPLIQGGRAMKEAVTSRAQRRSAMLSCARAVDKLHSVGIVHANIQPDAFSFVLEGASGQTVRAILKHFEYAHVEQEIPDPFETGGMDGYIAPEVVAYCDSPLGDGTGNPYRQDQGTAQDIFSLGMLFHTMAAGALPRVEGGAYAIDRAKIGDEALASLIEAMISCDPPARPTAADVIDALIAGRAVATRGAFEPLWPEHARQYEYTRNTARLRRVRRLDDHGVHRYTVCYAMGPEKDFTLRMMDVAGIVRPRVDGGADTAEGRVFTQGDTVYEADRLWPEHEGWQIDYNALDQRGYHGLWRTMRNGEKGYAVLDENGAYQPISFKMLTMLKCLVQNEAAKTIR